jgi:hypothetical protein
MIGHDDISNRIGIIFFFEYFKPVVNTVIGISNIKKGQPVATGKAAVIH